jgi:thiol:disulfide interchange protein DsbD
VAAALAGLALIGLAAWLSQAAGRWRRGALAGAALAGLAAVGAGGIAATASVDSARVGEPGAPEPFTPRRLAELRARGKPVLVNFTAAWCITCLVNERMALRSPAVSAALARKDVVQLTADWTRRDSDVTRVLESFGRSGVPLYVLYPGGSGDARREPTLLPAILTEGIVLDAVERL